MRGKAVRQVTMLSTTTPDDQVVFEDYRAVVRGADDRVSRLEAALREAGVQNRHAAIIRALQALRGVGHLTAITVVAEAGDLKRFTTARQFMAYCGLVPSERSSGGSRHRGAITKTGNALMRPCSG